jgi:transcriptional regulator with XRE-family HTH domain
MPDDLIDDLEDTERSEGIEIDARQKRAKRLKALRQMTGYTMREFARKCQIGFTTLNHWENVLSKSGLSKRGAERVVDFLSREGVYCDLGWLYAGNGPAPEIVDPSKLVKLNQKVLEVAQDELRDSLKINYAADYWDEIGFFKNKNPEHLIFVVKDTEMSPIYMPGDILAGIKIKSGSTLIDNRDCILELADQYCVRRLRTGSTCTQYNAFCINSEAGLKFPPMIDLTPISLAIITRIWKSHS